MSAVSATKIRELRRRTDAPMLQCKTILYATQGDVEQAVEQLRKQGITKAETRIGRRTTEGVMASYVHHTGKLGVLIEVNCETDFVARTDEFVILARQLAEHVAAAAPIAVNREAMPFDVVELRRRTFERQVRASGKPEHLVDRIIDGKMEAYFGDVVLMDQTWVREPKVKISDLVGNASAKTGEHIQVRRFSRFHMGLA
ncbi:MAG TPA: elongation factor Ts [Gemmatimonadaceae bacterium]|nr:elongation factor Ts [Gemmatimonadaceae bacterium]